MHPSLYSPIAAAARSLTPRRFTADGFARALVLTVWAAAPLTVAAQADAAADPVTFVGASTSVVGADSAKVVVINTSPEPVSLFITAQAVLTDGVRVPLVLTPTSIPDLESGASTTFTVRRGDSSNGKASGFILATVTGRTATTVLKHPLSVGPGQLTPAVSSWELTGWIQSGGDVVDDRPLPLADSTSCRPERSFPATLNSGSETIAIEASCHPQAEKVATLAIKPKGDAGLPGVGTYTGDLDIDGTKVTVTMRVGRKWWWALIPFVAGLILAIVFHGYVAVFRPVWRAANGLWNLGKEAKKAQGEFENSAGKEDWRVYSIARKAGESAHELAKEVSSSGLDFENTLKGRDKLKQRKNRVLFFFVLLYRKSNELDFKSALERGAKLRQLIADWPGVSEKLKKLKETDERLAKTGGILDGVAKLRDWERDLWSPTAQKVEKTAEEGSKLGADADAGVSALELAEVAFILDKALKEWNGTSPAEWQKRTLQDARAIMQEARKELMRAEEPSHLERDGVRGELRRVRSLLDRLIPETGTEPPPHSVTMLAANQDQGSEILEATERSRWVLGGLPPVLETRLTEGREERLSAFLPSPDTIRAFDWLVVVIVVLVTWAGVFTRAYFGKAWGTWLDISTMSLLALGGGVILTPLLEALHRAAEGPLRLRADSRSS